MRRSYRYLQLGLLLFSSLSVAAPQTQRVISLSPHTTELAYAAGLGNQLIAASDYSDYPEAAKSLERVANFRGIKLERIVTLKPDLILAWKGGNPPREMTKLEQLGFTIYYSNPVALGDIADAIEELGSYSAQPEIAKRNANEFRATLKALQIRHRNQRPVSYFYQLSSSPIITVSNKSWPSQVFTLCGGRNIFADSPAAYPQISEEQVIVRQPEVIFSTPHAGTETGTWQKWQGKLPAIDNQHIFSLQADWLNRPTPRTIKAVKQVCNYFDIVRQNTL
ncbi:vitamin B12 ABC transporter substrate-binding protein BtuF [uncultured Photobacterium sp.]|uniref:vitamin B12 ABC transporter substrate-binding protein BtuF n=1 Tax=uncultured Photobacterium sp. TaxID=173973 RepID=UPI002606F999|nr:vitamin B12 ABC transporter substrate-binding protein BtuF [uncultured Photobacterium sp.]